MHFVSKLNLSNLDKFFVEKIISNRFGSVLRAARVFLNRAEAGWPVKNQRSRCTEKSCRDICRTKTVALTGSRSAGVHGRGTLSDEISTT